VIIGYAGVSTTEQNPDHQVDALRRAGVAEGRAMFGMLSVLAEYQHELIIANTRDGVAAARARGRSGGRRPRLTSQQAAVAQQLYDAGQHTVAQIAAMFSVPRSTIYGHLDKTTIDQRPAVHPGETATAATAKPPAVKNRARRC